MRDTPLRRILDRIADITVLGLLTVASYLTLVAGLAGVTAAAHTLNDHSHSGSLPARFAHHLKGCWRDVLGLQVAWIAATVIGLADMVVGLAWARSATRSFWMTAPTLACGALLLLAVVILPAYLAALPTTGRGQYRTMLLPALTLACGLPATSALIGSTAAAGVTIALIFPAATPLLIGGHVLVSLKLVRRAVARRSTGLVTLDSAE